MLSKLLLTSSGVPQGSLLGPSSFAIYCHDLHPVCKNTFLLPFADDISEGIPIPLANTTCTSSHTPDIEKEWNNIQPAMASENGLTLNLSKCVSIRFTKKSVCVDQPLPFCPVSEFTFLGVIWSYDLSWTTHFRKQASRCSSRLYFLRILKSSLSHDEL